MSYCGNTTGKIGGLLPAPHHDVRIVLELTDKNRIAVIYEGSHAALLAAGAIDAWMATTPESVTFGRDIKLRPYSKERMTDGQVKITRTVASLDKAADLPGVRGAAVHVSPLKKRPHLRLVEIRR